MTTTRSKTAGDVLAAIEELAPMIRDRAEEIEQDRRVPADLLAELKHTGAFRTFRPVSHGGLGTELADALRVVEAVARIDGSTGWTLMIGTASWRDLAGLPRASFDEVFADPDAIPAGAFAPSGSIEPVDGGYRVHGRWAFASGCEHADWLWGNCIEGVSDEGVPQLRIAVLRPEQAEIEDTWDSVGLRGTGSHHIRVDGTTVDAAWTVPLDLDATCVDDAAARVPAPTLFALMVGAAALGLGRGALDDIGELAAGKVPLLAPTTVAANPVFHVALASSDTELAAGEALLAEHAAAVWDAAVTGRELTVDERVRVRAAATWAAERSLAAVEAAYRAGGGTSVYRTSPLQRRLRDIHALVQHFLVRPDTMATAGAVLAGQGLDAPVF